MQSDITVHDHP